MVMRFLGSRASILARIFTAGEERDIPQRFKSPFIMLSPPETREKRLSTAVGYLYGSTPVTDRKATIPSEYTSAGAPRNFECFFWRRARLRSHSDLAASARTSYDSGDM
eukprot:932483-Amorphochlora_amoeboformis.AAC.2